MTELAHSQAALLRAHEDLGGEFAVLVGQLASARQGIWSGHDRPRSADAPPTPGTLEHRPLWQAFTDGIGGTFDLSGETRRTRPRAASRTTLADDAHALCMVLGLLPDHDDDEGRPGR